MSEQRGRSSRGSARDAAQWRSDDSVWLDHATLDESDLGWLEPARCLTLWAVKMPPGLLRRLPRLEWLDIRGGSGPSAEFVEGCTHLRYLAINQIRGMQDLSAIAELPNLELLSLYGLPQVKSLPSLRRSHKLRRVDAGSLKGIEALAPLVEAPGLEELLLIRAVSLATSDPDAIAEHPALAAFDWFAEDVPDKTWVPVVEKVDKPKARAMHAQDWFDSRA